jgi:hypothetical protein
VWSRWGYTVDRSVNKLLAVRWSHLVLRPGVPTAELEIGCPALTWTQPCCERCWIDRHRVDLDGATEVPQPVHGLPPELEACCFCGLLTIMGVYVRIDPTSVPFPRDDPERR